ncbi:MAG: single-stranded-DNA-specific exonuclease RecJ [Candidatus Hydrogenedentes bacterium]|nr:single-stranded-DNA-specific exonuclease RecJ [Candidatus Hydrogenedentota bacterium]
MNPLGVRRVWNIAPQDNAHAQELARALEIPPIVAQLLAQRGLSMPDDARGFLSPALSQLTDPMRLTGMREAVERITQARDRDEQVLVFGDYDVDGISGAAILVNGLRRFGLTRVRYGMPKRLTEGYGIDLDHVDEAAAQGVSLIVTVDNGISAHAAADHARARGIDLIITDHHAIENGLPDALAVINPQREPEDYPGRHLCGAGVAFKLSTALNGTPNDLDIAALGTVADIVPLVGENRTIVALGLRHMARHQRNGIAKLAQVAGIDLAGISSVDIGFQIGPRINAAGRLDDGLAALELLLTECPNQAAEIARMLNEANAERRSIEKDIYDEAVEELEACFQPAQRGIVVAREGWHPGVIGIVASKLQGRYHRPVVVIAGGEDGTGRGSARANGGFDMVRAFRGCQDHLVKFGGHQSAAGFTIALERVQAFAEAFEAEAQAQLGTGDILSPMDVDLIAAFSEIDAALLHALAKLEPLGHGNPAPVFCTLGVEAVASSARILKDQHLKITFRQDGRSFQAIGFNMAERFYTEDLSGPVDIAYTPQFNSWRGETAIQLLLKDIRPAAV